MDVSGHFWEARNAGWGNDTGQQGSFLQPQMLEDWVEHLAKKVTWLPKPPLYPQEVAVFLGGSAMVLDSTEGGRGRTLNDQGKETLFGG